MIFWRRKKKKQQEEEARQAELVQQEEAAAAAAVAAAEAEAEAQAQAQAAETPDIEAEIEVEDVAPPEPQIEVVPEPVAVEPEIVSAPEAEIIPEAVIEPVIEQLAPEPEATPEPAPVVDVAPEVVAAPVPAPEPEIIPEPAQEPQVEPVTEEQAEEVQEQAEEDKKGWFKRLKTGLSKSSDKIGQGISDILTKKKLDQDTLDELEDLLIMADLGPATASKLVSSFGEGRFGKEISAEEIKEALAENISEILTPVAKGFEASKPDDGPFTILVCGVNGVGKTTTIGKLAQKLREDYDASVMMAAGDTFRAAAIEQLHIWAERTGSAIVSKELGSDAASVAYEAYSEAKEKDVDVLMIDTAGRLHNKSNLMAELEKIVRVLKKQNEALPHAVLLVLDATTGQNAHEQVKTFNEMVNVTGLVVTKLDGSARGGVVVSLADAFGLPIHYVGVGEQAADLQPFDPDEFAKSLMGLV